MHTTRTWFEVDKGGLAKLREGLPKSALLRELVQNAWDTNAGICNATLRLHRAGTQQWELCVEDDDPTGFKNLSHAYTLFAESEKKDKADKRGRFNLGEKLVLAMCNSACIESTTGTITFTPDGNRRENSKNVLPFGSRFTGILRMTKADEEEIRQAMFELIPPASCKTTYNGEEIPLRTPLKRFMAILPTVIGDAEGNMRASRRKCGIEVYEPLPGEEAMVYEMGIPVVESGDKYHYNVLQKVPLTMDRSNVTPAFLRDIREAVAEAMVEHITADDAQSTWVRVAASNPDASVGLVTKVFTARFGEDAVIYDPTDPEANKRAIDDGRTLVMGGHMSREEWANVKGCGITAPAGQVYTDHKIETSSDGREWTMAKEITNGMKKVKEFCLLFAKPAIKRNISVEFVSEMGINMSACYGSQVLRFNIARMGYAAFGNGLTEELIDLIIHELAHERAKDHLSDAFHEECTRIGAVATRLALAYPELYHNAGFKPRVPERV